ncbi:c-type cytochrome [Pelagovum pacificum]|uniref:Cytochrome c family protein n=1 Tax=Pelagovum pacificum TaxID=2588711 RepID=A0A5C5GDF9_9RHOB|nr:cytochrome c family protein [Pelagovum pacificum]QQA42495.1 cytochrome c family protein [Pelagovum pacificum]TNY31579.1 cytochrome c family protein [Pelagovum pacificum]
MFDTMTMTKIIGGFCGTFLIFLLGGWAAEGIYHPGGHGEGEQAYSIAVEESSEGGDGAAEEEGPAFEEVFAAADPAEGEGLFRNCQTCHSLEPGENRTGPSLAGVVGRPVDAVEGFSYSGALEEVVETWTPENLNHFIENPRGFAPGTAMSYGGMRRIEDRANLIAYLETVGG